MTKAFLSPISLPGDPTSPLHAATKDYVDRDTMRDVNLRTASAGAWTERIFSQETAVATGTTLTFEHGRAVFRGTGGAGLRSNRRTAFQIPNSPGGYSRLRSRWIGMPNNPGVAAALPQHAHFHGLQQVGGLWVAVVISHDVAFNSPEIQNLALWKQETSSGAGNMVVANGSPKDQWAVTSSVRTSNVVTLTGAAGHGFVKGDTITVDLANASYDGNFTVTSVTSTTVVYNHTGGNLTTSTGTARLQDVTNNFKTDLKRSTAFTTCTRTSGVCVATVAAGHPWVKGDEVAVDGSVASFDGIFRVKDITATTITWDQAGTDSAVANTGTIANQFPYWIETEWFAGHARCRVWPSAYQVGRAEAPPSWESNWSQIVPLSGLSMAEPDPTLGLGLGIGACHVSSGAATTMIEHRYDSISYSEMA